MPGVLGGETRGERKGLNGKSVWVHQSRRPPPLPGGRRLREGGAGRLCGVDKGRVPDIAHVPRAETDLKTLFKAEASEARFSHRKRRWEARAFFSPFPLSTICISIVVPAGGESVGVLLLYIFSHEVLGTDDTNL